MKSKINNIIDDIKNIKFKSNSLKVKVWIYLTTFTILILTLLWLFQIIFLNSFYESAKIKELNRGVNKIKENYLNNSLYSSLDLLAHEEGICIQIVVGNTVSYDVSNFNKGCILDTKSYRALFQNSDDDTATYKLVNPRYNNEVLIKAIKLDSNTYAYLSISLEPLDSAIKILKNQFVIVTIIVLILSLLLAFYISKKISKPIEDINKTASLMKNGNYSNTFYIEENILELNQLVETLNKTNKELSVAENLRRELLANVSHDLKTPLTMIKAYAEMVRDLTYKDRQKREENLNVIIEESDRLNLLVNDILELSVLQSGMDKLNIETFNLNELIKTILKRYSILEENNDYDFKFEYDDDYLVSADKNRIEQVIYNLLNNAVNYTLDDKRITIKIIDNNNYVRVQVIDNGMGIKKEDLKLIWKKYYKTDKTHKRDKMGTGIGLSIVENILIKHKFKYGVESIKSKGTTFWFEIKKAND